MDTPLTEISVIIVNWNTKDRLRDCLNSIYQAEHLFSFEVIVIDNASTDGSAEMVEKDFPRVCLLQNTINLGHAAANNQGLRVSRGECILLVNSDAVLKSGCIENLLNQMKDDPKIEALSAQSLSPQGDIQYSCRRFPGFMTALFDDTVLGWWFPNTHFMRTYRYRDWPHNDFRMIQQPPLTCLLVRRRLIERVGHFDARFFLYFSDVDWAKRIHAEGIPIYFTPQAKVVHFERVSIRRLNAGHAHYLWHKDRLYYYGKYFGSLSVVWLKAIFIADFLARSAKLITKRFLRMIPVSELVGHLKVSSQIILALP
ncbi:MAG: glycosyltransferase family 2 protein [Candidatus Omnitrophica bacterium]|nr:glycosyltransferase family 2 protein [Candidatus Omnitrophota bacterium]